MRVMVAGRQWQQIPVKQAENSRGNYGIDVARGGVSSTHTIHKFLTLTSSCYSALVWPSMQCSILLLVLAIVAASQANSSPPSLATLQNQPKTPPYPEDGAPLAVSVGIYIESMGRFRTSEMVWLELEMFSDEF
jgi:hypothetical protein